MSPSPSKRKLLNVNEVPKVLPQVVTLNFNVDQDASYYLDFMKIRERRTADVADVISEGIPIIRQDNCYFTIIRLFSKEDGEEEGDVLNTGLRLLFQESNGYLIGYQHGTSLWRLSNYVLRESVPFISGYVIALRYSLSYPNSANQVLANNALALQQLYRQSRKCVECDFLFQKFFYKYAVIFAEALRFWSVCEYVGNRLKGLGDEAGNLNELMKFHIRNWSTISNILHKDGKIDLDRVGINDDLSKYNMTVQDIKARRGIRVILGS